MKVAYKGGGCRRGERAQLAVFPDRQIGNLADGSEADFLVLSENPLDDIGNIKNTAIHVKGGVLLPER